MVSLYTNEDGTGDVALQLLEEGFLLAEHRREKRLQKLISEYKAAQNSAKKNRVCTSWHSQTFHFTQAKEYKLAFVSVQYSPGRIALTFSL